MHISKAMLIGYAKKIASINLPAIAVQLLVTLPGIGAVLIAAIVSFITPSASGFNTIPRMAAEFIYEKTSTTVAILFSCEQSELKPDAFCAILTRV